MATLSEQEFLDHVRSIYKPLAGGAITETVLRGQAAIFEALCGLHDLYQGPRKLIDQATGTWLDLHAASAGTLRRQGESDDALRARIRQAPDAITPHALERQLAIAITGTGLSAELLEGPDLAFLDECYLSYPPCLSMRFVDGQYSQPSPGSSFTPPAAGGTYSPLGLCGGSLLIAQSGGGARSCLFSALQPPPAGVSIRLSVVVKEQNAGSLSGAQVIFTRNGGTTTINVSNNGKLSDTSHTFTSDGVNPVSIQVLVPAGAGAGVEIGDFGIVAQSNAVMGDVWSPTRPTSIVLHAGGDYIPLVVAGDKNSPVSDSDAAADHRGGADGVPQLGAQLSALAALQAAKAAGFPLELWSDPFYP